MSTKAVSVTSVESLPTELIEHSKNFGILDREDLGSKPKSIEGLAVVSAVAIRFDREALTLPPFLTLVTDDTVRPSENMLDFRGDVCKQALPSLKTDIVGGSLTLGNTERPTIETFVDLDMLARTLQVLQRADAIAHTSMPMPGSYVPKWYKEIKGKLDYYNKPEVARRIAGRELISLITDYLPQRTIVPADIEQERSVTS